MTISTFTDKQQEILNNLIEYRGAENEDVDWEIIKIKQNYILINQNEIIVKRLELIANSLCDIEANTETTAKSLTRIIIKGHL